MELLATKPQDDAVGASLAEARQAQRPWWACGIHKRLALLREVRHRIANNPFILAQSISAQKFDGQASAVADTLAAEVLPLLEALRFLEREAAAILAPQHLSKRSCPLWLRGTTVDVHRDPLGIVLIIGPSNYPLFLPGVQAIQALAAGNAVLWKPAEGAAAVANALREICIAAGLLPALFTVLDESPEAASATIHAGVDKVFLTGSVETGRSVSGQLAEHITPSVIELSGCDAVFVLPGANLELALEALCFGLRFNGSATCMAPRRVFLVGDHAQFLPALIAKLDTIPAIALLEPTQVLLHDLIEDAELHGGTVLRGRHKGRLRYAVVVDSTPEMRIARTDIFAPVLSIFTMPDEDAAIAASECCPYALTAAIFGPERDALSLALRIIAGTVLINGLIVATADPRVPFGGCKSSGYGSTRGREGLLEMTAPKTIVMQGHENKRMYAPTTADHENLFGGYIMAVHGVGLKQRLQGLRQLLRAAAKLK